MNKCLRQIIFILIFLTTTFFTAREVYSQTEEELQKKIDEYQTQLSVLSKQANTLANQIKQFDAQIYLTTLKIQQTEEKIVLLGGRIDQLEVSLDALTKAFSSRAVETYKMARVENGFLFLVSANDLNDAVSRYHYLEKIQDADRSLLNKLQTAQTTYKEEKSTQEELQDELESQKATLNNQKAAKASLLAATQNDEKKYQQLLSEARAQLSAMRSFVAGQGGASILSNQTKCNSWGCYYNQRDSLWGNMSLGGSSYSVAEYGCLVSSVSMIASHYGRSIKPNDIASNSEAFVPSTGYLYHSFNASGVSVTINSASKSMLDSELSAGRPVIAGLYSGPAHFIVILRKDGDNYIMHDPFMEDGSERPLTDNYSVGDITSLRLVQFN
ncbi:C39 family peptidase [Patescibacteria group bacterium]